jgi:hypothetical protein
VVDSTAAREAALIERLAALEGEIATLRASLLMALAAIEARRVADEADEALFERTLVKAGLTPRDRATAGRRARLHLVGGVR